MRADISRSLHAGCKSTRLPENKGISRKVIQCRFLIVFNFMLQLSNGLRVFNRSRKDLVRIVTIDQASKFDIMNWEVRAHNRGIRNKKELWYLVIWGDNDEQRGYVKYEEYIEWAMMLATARTGERKVKE